MIKNPYIYHYFVVAYLITLLKSKNLNLLIIGVTSITQSSRYKDIQTKGHILTQIAALDAKCMLDCVGSICSLGTIWPNIPWNDGIWMNLSMSDPRGWEKPLDKRRNSSVDESFGVNGTGVLNALSTYGIFRENYQMMWNLILSPMFLGRVTWTSYWWHEDAQK